MSVPTAIDGIDRDTPSIWFPWFRKFDLEKYKKRVNKYQREAGENDNDIEAIIATNATIFREAGDTVIAHPLAF